MENEMRNALLNTFSRLRSDEKGVTLVEYGIAIVLAIVVGTTALMALSAQINTNLGDAVTAMQDRTP